MVNRIISFFCSVMLAMAIGVAFMFAWFAVDTLRYFPVGEDSPTAIGFPVGFVVGIIIWRRFRDSISMHILLVVAGLPASTVSFLKFTESGSLASQTNGWEGFSHVFDFYVWAVIFIGSVCALLSGILSLVTRQLKDKNTAEQDVDGNPLAAP